MGKSNGEQKQGKWKKSVKTGIAATGFITAILVVMLVCYIFQIEISTLAIGLIVVVALVVGIPLFIFATRENTDIRDENATCQPIMKKYWAGHSTKALVADYDAWTQGEHSSYSRVHFGGDVVSELLEAKEYGEALRILDELEGIDMKSRERYDYENFRDKVRPELLEGIEKQERQAEERARNKNLRKK